MIKERYAQAQTHFLKGDSPKEFGEMLVNWAKQGYPSEYDLYIARAVLMYVVEFVTDCSRI